MRNRVAVWLTVALLLTAASPLLASGAEDEAGWGILLPIGKLFNLLIVVGPLVYFARKPLKEFFTTRRATIRHEMAEALRVKEEAQQKLDDVNRRMKGLESELAQIRRAAEENAESERQRLLAEAEQDAQRVVSTARRDIDNLKRHARSELKQYAARLSVQLAEGEIRRKMRPQDEERVVERFFSSLHNDSGE